MYVCMYVCMYMYIYVCVCVYIYILAGYCPGHYNSPAPPSTPTIIPPRPVPGRPRPTCKVSWYFEKRMHWEKQRHIDIDVYIYNIYVVAGRGLKQHSMWQPKTSRRPECLMEVWDWLQSGQYSCSIAPLNRNWDSLKQKWWFPRIAWTWCYSTTEFGNKFGTTGTQGS